MKRHFYLLTSLLVIGLFSVIAYGQDVTMNGQESAPPKPKPCSVKTANGAYGILLKGTILNAGPNVPIGPTASVGIIKYDGAGSFTSSFTTNFSGFIVPQELSGSYTIESDCTGVLTTSTATAPFIITADGREVRSLQGYPAGVAFPAGMGWIIEAVGKKIAPEPLNDSWRERIRVANFTCNPANIAGAYAIRASGAVLKGTPFPEGPMLGLSYGIVPVFGKASFKGTFNFNGLITSVTDTSTGSVKRDCTATAVQANGAIQKLVYVNGGTEFFFLQLPPEGAPNIPGNGVVLSGEGKRVQTPKPDERH